MKGQRRPKRGKLSFVPRRPVCPAQVEGGARPSLAEQLQLLIQKSEADFKLGGIGPSSSEHVHTPKPPHDSDAFPLLQHLDQLIKQEESHKRKSIVDEEDSISEVEDSKNESSRHETRASGILRINQPQNVVDRFHEVLHAEPDMGRKETSNVPMFGFLERLQKVLHREKLQRQHYAKVMQRAHGTTQFLDLRILTKRIEAHLSVCTCQIVDYKGPGDDSPDNSSVTVLFNTRANNNLELEIGKVIRVHEPWHEFTSVQEKSRILLCTYLSEMVS